MSSGDRSKIFLIQAHHCEVGRLLSHELPIESGARHIHSPKLPINGVTAKMERVTRNCRHQSPPRTAAARGRPNVKVPKPEAFLSGVRFEGSGHERVANQL